MFVEYKDIDGDSGVAAYEIGDDYIAVRFKTDRVYIYSYATAGEYNVETMKQLAKLGDGLNRYIMKYCKTLYVK